MYINNFKKILINLNVDLQQSIRLLNYNIHYFCMLLLINGAEHIYKFGNPIIDVFNLLV